MEFLPLPPLFLFYGSDKKVSIMPFGFYRENRLRVYGNGEGEVVIEEYIDDDCEVPINKISISWARFEAFQDFYDILRKEAFHGIEGVNDEA
jgi:hypothetical protein